MFNSDSVLVPEVVEAGFGRQLTDSLEYPWGADDSAVGLRNGNPGKTRRRGREK